MDQIHVLPLNDLKSHVEAGEYCHCKPRIQWEVNGAVVVHNAYDGREFFEVENPVVHRDDN